MKTISFIIVFFILCSCSNRNEEEKYYRAISYDKNDTAYLKLSEIDNQFVGKYLVIYKDRTFDLGNVSGEIISDTLKGRNKYVSRRKSKFTKPFVLLKENNQMKLGTGMVSYYSQIPFFANGTIQFPDTLFKFVPINENQLSNLKEKYNFK
nr:hypothetical protein [uncultured Flavobacterium sp.]